MGEVEHLHFIAVGKEIGGVLHWAGVVCSRHAPSDRVLVVARGHTDPLPLAEFYNPEIRKLIARIAHIPARTPNSVDEHQELLARHSEFFNAHP